MREMTREQSEKHALVPTLRNPSPSPGDDETTRDVDQGARLIGLILIDHVIIGETGYYSYADSGKLQEFRA